LDTVKVILADSNELIRAGLNTILTRNERINIVAEPDDSVALRYAIAEKDPDVVVIDYTADDFSIDVIPEILAECPDVKFVAVTYEQAGYIVVNALKAGVMSHVKKDCSIEEITDAVLETAAGKKFFCGTILESLRTESIDVEAIGFDPLSCEPISLSVRELEIMTLIAQGNTNNEIAEQLFLSSHTITTHRKNIMAKLGVNNTAGIVMYAVKSNLVSPNKYLFSGQS
jgi:DNA-binding NarL/FixJ family response regulator